VSVTTPTTPTTPAAPRLRDAHWTDVPALAALEVDLFAHDAWSQQTWWAELAGRPRRDYVVLTDTEGVLGYAGLDHGGDVADVMTVAVAPRARRRGLAKLLLEVLEQRALDRGASHLMLEVRVDNTAAIGLYEGAGYTLLSTRRRYYQPGDVDALVMRKSLQENGPDDA
jgi:ribosomal-protein-alanine N-acetyltransferase